MSPSPGPRHPREPAVGSTAPRPEWVLPLADVTPDHLAAAGGKAVALGALQRAGVRIPPGVCLLSTAYDTYVRTSGLDRVIALELARKRFEDMRWEELWDVSLRIRNAFARTPLPADLRDPLVTELANRFSERPVAVRSSARGEDTATTSFAGLHESIVNVSGTEATVEALLRVWASLWSDRALLYRQELQLDVETGTIAVVIQELVVGECSGVAFGVDPGDPQRMVVEAVWGLNQGLVDGTVEPDRWILERTTGDLLEHVAPQRVSQLVPSGCEACGHEVALVELDPGLAASPPLDPAGLDAVVGLVRACEGVFGRPQDVEWTISNGVLHALQSRPVTTAVSPASGEAEDGDQRGWYLSLTRSFDNLRALRRRIEDEAIPAMIADADAMAAANVGDLSDAELAREIERRVRLRDHWVGVYWQEFIPFAHGMRLFGQVYTDVVRPEDPYEFLDLLAGGGLLSVERHRQLDELAALVAAAGPGAPAERMTAGTAAADTDEAGARPDADLAVGTLGAKIQEQLDAFLDRFGSGPGTPAETRLRERDGLMRLLTRLAAHRTETPSAEGNHATADTGEGPGIVEDESDLPPSERVSATPTRALTPSGKGDLDARTEHYLARFSGEERRFQEELLDLARASYRMRDDDNLHLDRVEAGLRAALDEGRRRLGERDGSRAADAVHGASPQAPPAGTRGGTAPPSPEQATAIIRSLEDPTVPFVAVDDTLLDQPLPSEEGFSVRARQLVGQPAGPGVAVGIARVILDPAELFDFREGEILVCDALDPTMTFVVPLAAAVVERRGGMLIHGAIIAREYGLPCVTGVPGATELIATGDTLTVDGYLGIVVIGGSPPGDGP